MPRGSFHGQLWFSTLGFLEWQQCNTKLKSPSVTSDRNEKLFGVQQSQMEEPASLADSKLSLLYFFSSSTSKTFCLIHRSLYYNCRHSVVSGWDPLLLPCWFAALTFRLTGRMTGRTCFAADPWPALGSAAAGHSLPQEPIKVRACGCTPRPEPSTGWAAAPNLLILQLHPQGDPTPPWDDMHLLYTHYREGETGLCSCS